MHRGHSSVIAAEVQARYSKTSGCVIPPKEVELESSEQNEYERYVLTTQKHEL